jgi:hypothetical protein
MIALTTVSVFLAGFSVSEVSAAGKGMVRFIGYVGYPEVWRDTAMYGSYECFVTIAWVISDAEGFLTVGSSVSVCHTFAPLGLTIGELVACYGYYYYSEGRKQEVGHIDCGVLPESEYFVTRVSTLADVNRDLVVDIFDIVQCAGAYGSTPSDPNWSIHCDVAEPYWAVDIFDIVMIASRYGEQYTP